MADKIKRYYAEVHYFDDDRAPIGTHRENERGNLVLHTDHQASMREAVGLLRECSDKQYDFAGLSERTKRIDAFLSAHQECGGGG